MRNIWQLFKGDLRRLTSNVASAIIVVGLIALPSIFTWYNVLACWDTFENTGNLTVAVANTDEGYKSDLVPLKMNIGEQVIAALHENDQIDWVFTDEADAIDGARSGRYYAAVVIPPSFSKDMMTFYSADVEHARLIYYTNEKKNAVSPKVTDQAADAISTQVNTVFSETLSEAALNISASLLDYAETSDLDGRIGELSSHAAEMASQMDKASQTLSAYSALLGSSQGIVSQSAALLGQAADEAGSAMNAADGGKQAVGGIADAMQQSADSLGQALQATSDGLVGVSDSVDAAFDSAGTLAGDSAAQMRSQAAAIDEQAARYRDLAAQLEGIRDQLPEAQLSALDAVIARLNSSADLLSQLSASLNTAAGNIESGTADVAASRQEAKQLVEQARQSVEAAKADYDANLKPAMEDLASRVSDLSASLSGTATELVSAGEGMAGASGSVLERLSEAQGKLDASAADLGETADKLTELSNGIDEALSTGDVQKLRDIVGSDPTTLAQAIAAPVQLERTALYPVQSFGAAMSPLYTSIAIWVGSLLLVVAIKAQPSAAIAEGLRNARPWQLFFGRFGVFSIVSVVQSTCLALGNLLFVGIDAVHPLLYVLCMQVSGLVCAFIMYTLVASFANLGKAIGVLLLVLQVGGGGAGYPLPLLPEFFQAVSPFLPASHIVEAMRAAMLGLYGNDFWVSLGTLCAFVVPCLILGLVLRVPLMSFMNWYVGKVESSKLM